MSYVGPINHSQASYQFYLLFYFEQCWIHTENSRRQILAQKWLINISSPPFDGYKKFDLPRRIENMFTVHNTISLSCHEQVCLIRLHFERYFSYHQARWWEKYLSKCSLIKHTCSWRDKFVLRIENLIFFTDSKY